MFRIFKHLVAVLLAACYVNAATTEGSIKCDGLFLVDKEDLLLRTKGCQIADSIQTNHWTIAANIYKYNLESFFFYNHKNRLYSWDLSINNEISGGQIQIQKDFQNISFALSINSLPYYKAETRYHLPDSLFFAKATFARANPELFNLKWNSKVNYSIIPNLDSDWKDSIVYRSIGLGSHFFKHTLEANFLYGESTPDAANRLGYIFSDSSHFWIPSANYTYMGFPNRIDINWAYAYADLYIFGLLREEENEKRFLFLPIALDANLYSIKYTRYTGNSIEGSQFNASVSYAKIFLNIPWESRRFYETLAPNRALTTSILKTLSFSIFTRNFKIYGKGETDLYLAQIGYQWNKLLKSWTIEPELEGYLAFGNASGDIKIRKETQGLLWLDSEADTLGREFSFAGILPNFSIRATSPSRHFHLGMGLSQVIPFYFSNKKIQKYADSVKNKDEEKPSSEPSESSGSTPPKPSSSSPAAPPKEEAVDSNENNSKEKSLSSYLSDISDLALKNGFAIHLEIGVRF